MRPFKRTLVWILTINFTVSMMTPMTALARSSEASSGERGGGHTVRAAAQDDVGRAEGLSFRLSEGEARRERPAEVASRARVEKLSAEETERILRRLPPLRTEEGDRTEFALRERSLPPPRAGATVLAPFPAREDRPAPGARETGGAFEVVRFAPTGEVPLAPHVTATFSQSMVAVTSQAEAARTVPLALSPAVEGRWRWLGTKTVVFEPASGRLPMATEFRVSLSPDARSASGAKVSSPVSWTFSTPAPQVVRKHPEGGPVRRDALMFVEFDQRVEPSAVLRTVRVSGGGKTLRVRLATEDEVKADESVNNLRKRAAEGRWLAFRAVGEGGSAALPPNASVAVDVGPGTPSAEGPRATTKAQSFSFKTYGPLRVREQSCGWQRLCTPFEEWYIRFNNSIDPEAFDRSQLKIEPELPDAEVEVYGDSILIGGAKRPRTAYRVTIASTVKDAFGQMLGAPITVTFKVGAARRALFAPGDSLVVLDPASAPVFSAYSINHERLKVSVRAVRPEDWETYQTYLKEVHGRRGGRRPASPPASPPGALVFSSIVATKSAPDEIVETHVSMSPALRDGRGRGHALLVVEPLVGDADSERLPVVRWVQVTGIGLDAFVDAENLTGLATSLADGRPLAGVEMELYKSGARALTSPDGLARLPLPSESGTPVSLLVARRGADSAILPEHEHWWYGAGGWTKRERRDFLRWYVFDDRKMYRPGEEVSVKGWIRRVGAGPSGDVGALGGAARAVVYKVEDGQGNEVARGRTEVNALGGFHLNFSLPATMNLGYARLKLEVEGGDRAFVERNHEHAFQVQEFRRPEFEVRTEASEGPHFVGGHALATVAANYYAGGGLANSEVKWSVTARPAQYTPPNRGDFTFGKWIPWWEAAGDAHGGASKTQSYTGSTDASGKHHLRIDFDSVNPPRPSTVTAQATVEDVNRQAWTGAATMLVHPSELYVGLRSPRTFVQKGEPLIVESIVTNIDGRLEENRAVRVRAALLEWKREDGEWRQVERDAEECEVRSASEAVRCVFRPKEGGAYRVTARVVDDRDRPNESELTLWVAGGRRPTEREVKQEKVELVPDRKEYRAGDVAEILVQSPFAPAEGVLTLRRSGLVRTERFRMDGSSHTLRIPIEEGFVPNLHVQVDLVGAAVRTDDEGKAFEELPKRPAYASGALDLSVPPLARRLHVAAAPRERVLEPGGETVVRVEVKDSNGRPVNGGEVAVVVVDEAVLALSDYKLEDPVSIFYSRRDDGTNDYHSRRDVLILSPEELAEQLRHGGGVGPGRGGNTGGGDRGPSYAGGGAGRGGGGGADYSRRYRAAKLATLPVAARRMNQFALTETLTVMAGAEEEEAEAIRMRENFNALAVFAPSVPTGEDGRAEVKVKLPDNLTRYRVMAVSVAGGKQFGSGESAITARQPLMVRPSAPRFLNFGDRFELPVVVQNQTDAPLEVGVAVRAANAELTDGGGRKLVVAANDRAEVRFPVAASRAGAARFQIGIASGRYADAAQISLPVWTPATTEAFATYGELDGNRAVVHPVKAPPDVYTQFGGLELTTSSTELQALTDAVLYLVSYPFECSEQLSSRVLAVAALRDVLAAFDAKGLPAPEEMREAVGRDIERLAGMQNADGGFPFWRRGEESWPYVSVHASHALARAREKKFDVPREMVDRSLAYLRDIEKRIPKGYGREARTSLAAYALYTRTLHGDADASKARHLVATEGADKLPLEAAGWLLAVLSNDAASATETAALRRHLNNRAEETAATAHFTASYADDDYLLLNSSRRADAVILEALIINQPESDLVPKIVRGLLAHRRKGRWENTQENAFVLLALDRYFRTFEKTTPDFVARVWLGDSYGGEQEFRGRTTERKRLNVPMRQLGANGETRNLVLQKEGAGRLYYRLGMNYAPASLKLDAADYGFTVERTYEAVDDAADVRRDADGTWRIRSGSRVRVRLTMHAPARRYHVALVDPLPAGLEPLNPALAVTGSIPQDERARREDFGWWWTRTWFEHQNMRDERVEAFTSLLWAGVHDYTYVARATTPGAFVVPPSRAEEMYHPETFGRSSTDRVVVE